MQQLLNRKSNIYLLSIFSLLIFSIGLLVAWNTPAIGFESSIYQSTPAIFWIGIFLGYAVGILFLSLYLFRDSNLISLKWLGLFHLSVSAIALSALHILRGYSTLNIYSDTGTHIGMVINTISQGHIPDTYYPGLYSECSIIQLFSDINIYDQAMLIPIFMTFLTIMGITLCARKIFPDVKVSYLVLLFMLFLPYGSATFVGTYTHKFVGMTIPDALMVFLYLLLLLILYEKSLKTFVFAIILCIAMIFYHPVVSTIAILFLCVTTIYFFILYTRNKYTNKRAIYQILLLLFITSGSFVLWYWSYFGKTVQSIYYSLFSDLEEINAGNTLDMLSEANALGFSFDTVLRVASITLIIYGLFSLSLFVYIKYYRNNPDYKSMALFYVLFFALGGYIFLVLFSSSLFTYTRLTDLLLPLAVLGAGFAFYHFYIKVRGQSNFLSSKYLVVIIVILLLICTFSIISYHPSSLTLNPGVQSTEATLSGVKTVLPIMNLDLEYGGIWFTSIWRIADAFYSLSTIETNAYGDVLIINTGMISSQEESNPLEVPYHFNYTAGEGNLGQFYSDNIYLNLIEKDRKYYLSYYPELIPYRWSTIDFAQLEFDSSVNKLYSNKGYDLYYIHGTLNQ